MRPRSSSFQKALPIARQAGILPVNNNEKKLWRVQAGRGHVGNRERQLSTQLLTLSDTCPAPTDKSNDGKKCDAVDDCSDRNGIDQVRAIEQPPRAADQQWPNEAHRQNMLPIELGEEPDHSEECRERWDRDGATRQHPCPCAASEASGCSYCAVEANHNEADQMRDTCCSD